MSDSVGKISLDLEVKSDVEKQIGAISNTIGKNLKASIEGSTGNIFSGMKKQMDKTLGSMNSTLKKSLEGMKDTAKNALSGAFATAKNIKLPRVQFPKSNVSIPKQAEIGSSVQPRAPPVPKINTGVNLEAVRAQIDNLTKGLDITNSKIEQQQGKLTELKESYANAFNQDRKNKLQEEILKTESAINKLMGASDKTGFKLADLDKQFEMLSNSAKNATAGVSSVTNNIGKISGSTSKVSASLKRASSSAQETGRHTGMLGRTADSTGNKFSHMGSSISRSFGRMLRQVFVVTVIYKALRGLMNYTGSALMTNAQFVNSLNQIKTNLMVAFMPIYQAVLPALNALMSGLANVTAYIATFISAIFGKTYQQSFKAAKGLNTAKAAMGSYGKTAKKTAKDVKEAQGSLMGFDEINTLSMSKEPSGSDDSGGGGGGMPVMSMPNVDVSPASAAGKVIEDMVAKLKAVLATIFQPFKNAWEKEGQETITSIKYAFFSILDLLGSIGKSMLTVWSNGSGEAILIVLLQIFQNIFNVIGDIASTFATAWNSGDIGTSIIQGISNIIFNLLTLVKKVGDSFREVWADIGTPLANIFMEVLKSTIDVLENVSQKLVYVWDNGGSHLFEGFIRLGAKIFELAGYIYTEFVAPFVEWFIDLIAPAIAKVMDSIGDLLDVFSGLISWLVGDGKPVLDTIIIVLTSMAVAFGLVTLATNIGTIATGAWTVISGIATGVTTAFGVAVAFLTSPFGIAVLAIGAAIAIGVLLYKNWDVLKEKASEAWEYIKQKFCDFKNWLGAVFATDWSAKFGGFGDILNAFLGNVSNIFNAVRRVFRGIIDFIAGVFTGDWSRAWSGVVNIFGGIFDGIKSLAKAPLNGVIGLVNAAIGGLNKISLPDWVPGIGGKGINIPKIPRLARGGVLDQPTLNIAGEAGKEAVIPLENNTQGLDLLAEKLMERLGGLGGQGNNSNSDSDRAIEIILELGGSEFARFIIDSINKLQRQEGRTLLKI